MPLVYWILSEDTHIFKGIFIIKVTHFSRKSVPIYFKNDIWMTFKVTESIEQTFFFLFLRLELQNELSVKKK